MKIKNKFPYKTAKKENLLCNFCMHTDFKTIEKKDRNRLRVQTVICKNCGLIFINPRMTKEWYGKYYDGEYRNQVCGFKGADRKTEYNIDFQFKRAYGYGKDFGDMMELYVKKGLTIEIGSNAGGALAYFRDNFNVPVLGIEPSPEASEYAEKQGVKTICSLFEDLGDDVPKASNILSLRTLSHMLDPRKFFIWANEHLENEGYLLLDVVNFFGVLNKFRYAPRAIQVGHVYMFTPDTLKQFIESFGFEVVFMDLKKKNKDHIYIAARKISNVDLDSIKNGNYLHVYEKTIKEFKEMRGSYIKFFLKFEIKRKVLIWYYKIRRIFKKILIKFGVWRR